MVYYIVGGIAGCAAGVVLGLSRKCKTGSCPLTSNPYLGGVFGAIWGVVIASFIMGAVPASTDPADLDTNSVKASHTIDAETENSVATKEEEHEMSEATLEGKLVHVKTEQEFNELIKNSEQKVLVDFWAPWCGPCRAMTPVLEDLAKQSAGKLVVAKLNVDEVGAVAQKYSISAIPSLIIFSEGQESKRMVGFQSLDSLKQTLGL